MATIKDIAKYCGFGVATVSRALNNQPGVSEEKKHAVAQAVRELGYIPNNSARNLVMSSSNTIALVVRGVSNPFFTKMIDVIDSEISKSGYSLLLHHIGIHGDEFHEAGSLALEKNLRGIIFLGGRFYLEQKVLASLRIPFVFTTFTDSFSRLDNSTYTSIAIDDEKEALRAVSYLCGMGHRKIAALVSETDDQSISELRYKGYLQALESHGIRRDPSYVIPCHAFDMASAYEAMSRSLKRGLSPTAVFAISDAMAIAAMRALHDAGRKVPEDVSVLGFDGLDMGRYQIPSLTTFKQPDVEMAIESARMIVRLIENKRNRQLVFTTELIERESCCPPREDGMT